MFSDKFFISIAFMCICLFFMSFSLMSTLSMCGYVNNMNCFVYDGLVRIF